jgi:CRISPR-associated exonuclease Cas4
VPDTVAFSDLARAAYCPRQLYYARRDDDSDPPAEYEAAREIAGRYDDLAVASTAALATFDLAVEPAEFRSNLARSLDRHPGVGEPHESGVFLRGKDAHGRVDKLVPGADSGLVPSLVTHGCPPETGVWEQQGVRATAAAKALAWREEREIESALVEYARHGVVREVSLTTRRKAAYRRALRAARGLDGPPPRIHDESKCGACDYRETCGTKTRTLGSLLSLGDD